MYYRQHQVYTEKHPLSSATHNRRFYPHLARSRSNLRPAAVPQRIALPISALPEPLRIACFAGPLLRGYKA